MISNSRNTNSPLSSEQRPQAALTGPQGKDTMTNHFEPVERKTHRTPDKYRRIAVRLTGRFSLREVAYIFEVSTSAVQQWEESGYAEPVHLTDTL